MSSTAILPWFAMFCACLSQATLGPVAKWFIQHNVKPLMFCAWRCTGMVLFLAPLAWIEHQSTTKSIGWLEIKPNLSHSLWIHVFIAGLGWAGNLVFWVVGLQYTTTVRASLLSTTYPIMLVVVLSFKGIPVSLLEKLGIAIAMIGLIVTTLSAKEPSNPDMRSKTGELQYLLGDGLCLMSAVCETAVIMNRQKTRPYVPLFLYTAVTTMIVAMICSILAVCFGGNVLCPRANCLLGYLSPQASFKHPFSLRLFLQILQLTNKPFHQWITKSLPYSAVGVALFMCFNYSLQYFSPLLFSAITLVDPACTGFVSFIMGIEGIPDMYTWLGGTVVLLGIAFVLLGESSRAAEKHEKEEEDIGEYKMDNMGRYEHVDESSERSSGITELESPSPPIPSKSMSSPSIATASVPVSPLMLSPRRGELRTNSFHSHKHDRSNDENNRNGWTEPYLKRFNSTGETPVITVTTHHHHDQSRGLPPLTRTSSLEEKGNQENEGGYQYYYHAGNVPDEIATV